MCIHIERLSTSDKIVLLTLFVALSAYLATIRLFLIDRIQKIRERGAVSPDEIKELEANLAGASGSEKVVLQATIIRKKKEQEEDSAKIANVKKRLSGLKLPDFLIITASALLGLNVLYCSDQEWMYIGSVILFTAGGLVLVVFHALNWRHH